MFRSFCISVVMSYLLRSFVRLFCRYVWVCIYVVISCVVFRCLFISFVRYSVIDYFYISWCLYLVVSLFTDIGILNHSVLLIASFLYVVLSACRYYLCHCLCVLLFRVWVLSVFICLSFVIYVCHYIYALISVCRSFWLSLVNQ